MKPRFIAAMFVGMLACVVVISCLAWAQGGPGQGRGSAGGCRGEGACQLEFTAPLDDVALIEPKLASALADELQARALYARVIEQFGELRPFSNIIHAEERHAELLGRLYQEYGLAVPEEQSAAEEPSKDPLRFATLAEAAQAALDAELANAELYDDLLSGVSDPDVIAVFEQLQWASRERHLPALQRAVETGGHAGGGGRRQGPYRH